MTAWRAAGLNYINYSNIAAKILRQSLKADIRAEAAKRDASTVKITKWADGKPIRIFSSTPCLEPYPTFPNMNQELVEELMKTSISTYA